MTSASISAPAEIIKVVECEDGYSLQYRVWPAHDMPVATIILVNGVMSHSGWFRELGAMLAALQLKVVGADRRGSGLNHDNRGDARSRHILLSDLRKILEREESGVPAYVAGWCWGAVLAVNAALEFGSMFKGLVLLAPGLFPSEKINRAMRSTVREAQDTPTDSPRLESPITQEMFTNIPCFRKFISTDILALRSFTPRFLEVSRKMSLVAAARLSQLAHPVLLLLAAHDQTVDNKTTLERFRKLRSVDLTSATLPCNHGVQFEAPREIARHIAGWLALQAVPVRLSPDSL